MDKLAQWIDRKIAELTARRDAIDLDTLEPNDPELGEWWKAQGGIEVLRELESELGHLM